MSKQLKLKEIRNLLNDRDRNTVLHLLNGLPDNQQIQWLKKALQLLQEAPELTTGVLPKLINRFEEFSRQAESNKNELEETLLATATEYAEYNRTGINPHSKQAQFEGLVDDVDSVIYEDTSLLGLLIVTDATSPDLDKFVGNLNDWIENCSKEHWQKRIASLKALKELEPIRENLNEIVKNRREGQIERSKEWMAPLVLKIVSVEISDSKNAHKKVTKIFNNEYNNFIREFDFTSLKTPFISGGRRIKKSIALALMHIYSQREDDEIKEYTTITKHYKEL